MRYLTATAFLIAALTPNGLARPAPDGEDSIGGETPPPSVTGDPASSGPAVSSPASPAPSGDTAATAGPPATSAPSAGAASSDPSDTAASSSPAASSGAPSDDPTPASSAGGPSAGGNYESAPYPIVGSSTMSASGTGIIVTASSAAGTGPSASTSGTPRPTKALTEGTMNGGQANTKITLFKEKACKNPMPGFIEITPKYGSWQAHMGDAQVMSYNLTTSLGPDVQLDWFGRSPDLQDPASRAKGNCAQQWETTSPDKNGNALGQNTCYEFITTMPVHCFKLVRTKSGQQRRSSDDTKSKADQENDEFMKEFMADPFNFDTQGTHKKSEENDQRRPSDDTKSKADKENDEHTKRDLWDEIMNTETPGDDDD